jgi:hypothetical protein
VPQQGNSLERVAWFEFDWVTQVRVIGLTNYVVSVVVLNKGGLPQRRRLAGESKRCPDAGDRGRRPIAISDKRYDGGMLGTTRGSNKAMTIQGK